MHAGGANKKTTTKKGAKPEADVDDRQPEVDASKTNNDDQPQLGGIDKLPPVDTPEASSISATRY